MKKIFIIHISILILLIVNAISQSLNPEDEIFIGWIHYFGQDEEGLSKQVKDFNEIINVYKKDFVGKYVCYWTGLDTFKIYYKKGKFVAELSGVDCDQRWKYKLKNFKINGNTFKAKKFIGKLVTLKSDEFVFMKGLVISQKLDEGVGERGIWRSFYIKIE